VQPDAKVSILRVTKAGSTATSIQIKLKLQ